MSRETYELERALASFIYLHIRRYVDEYECVTTCWHRKEHEQEA